MIITYDRILILMTTMTRRSSTVRSITRMWRQHRVVLRRVGSRVSRFAVRRCESLSAPGLLSSPRFGEQSAVQYDSDFDSPADLSDFASTEEEEEKTVAENAAVVCGVGGRRRRNRFGRESLVMFMPFVPH